MTITDQGEQTEEHTGVNVSATESKIRSSTNDVTWSTTSQLSFDTTACPASAMFAKNKPRLPQTKAYTANKHPIGGNLMEDKPKLS